MERAYIRKQKEKKQSLCCCIDCGDDEDEKDEEEVAMVQINSEEEKDAREKKNEDTKVSPIPIIDSLHADFFIPESFIQNLIYKCTIANTQ